MEITEKEIIVIAYSMYWLWCWKYTCTFRNHKWTKGHDHFYCEKCGLCKVTENAK